MLMFHQNTHAKSILHNLGCQAGTSEPHFGYLLSILPQKQASALYRNTGFCSAVRHQLTSDRMFVMAKRPKKLLLEEIRYRVGKSIVKVCPGEKVLGGQPKLCCIMPAGNIVSYGWQSQCFQSRNYQNNLENIEGLRRSPVQFCFNFSHWCSGRLTIWLL